MEINKVSALGIAWEGVDKAFFAYGDCDRAAAKWAAQRTLEFVFGYLGQPIPDHSMIKYEMDSYGGGSYSLQAEGSKLWSDGNRGCGVHPRVMELPNWEVKLLACALSRAHRASYFAENKWLTMSHSAWMTYTLIPWNVPSWLRQVAEAIGEEDNGMAFKDWLIKWANLEEVEPIDEVVKAERLGADMLIRKLGVDTAYRHTRAIVHRRGNCGFDETGYAGFDPSKGFKLRYWFWSEFPLNGSGVPNGTPFRELFDPGLRKNPEVWVWVNPQTGTIIPELETSEGLMPLAKSRLE